MPIIEILVAEGRTPEQLRKMITSVTNAVASSLTIPQSSVRVILQEIDPTHWAAGDITLAERNVCND